MTGALVAGQLDAENPWPGLDAFEESAHDYFHGRGGEAHALLRAVLDSPVTVLYGRSGLGKTSLLQAALFPRLRRDHHLPISIRLDYKPDALPIADQLRETVREALQAEVPDARLPGADESIWEYLHRIDLELWSSSNHLLTPVLVIDQFEEVFTLGQHVPGLVERFRDDLGDLIENRIPADLAARLDEEDASAHLALRSRNYRLLLSLREDFLPDLEGWRPLIPLLGRPRQRLLPMNTAAAFEAVHEPAAHILTADQARRIVQFIAGENIRGIGRSATENGPAPTNTSLPVEPALLSLFCRELNEARRRGAKPHFDEQLIEGAQRDVLTNYYTSCIEGLPVGVARFVETQLITQKGFRNSYARDDAVPFQLTEDELVQLIHSRLIRLEERYGTQRIELSHDVLTGVVRERRDQRAAEEEQAALAGRLEAERLAAAERERVLDEERILEKDKRIQSERVQLRLRWLSIGLAILLVTASVLGIISYNFYRDAQRQRGLALSRLMSSQAAEIVDRQPQVAILLGLESLSAARDVSSDVPPALVTALARTSHASQLLTGHTAAVVGVTFSPDGRLLATASADHTVRLWDTVSGQLHGEPLTGHSESVSKVAFSPDGKLLASASADRTVRLWDPATGLPHGQPLTGHTGTVESVAFSPDGNLLASAGADGTVRLWDTATGRPHGPTLAGHAGGVNGVAFSPDGKLLASAGTDRTVRLWDTATGQAHGQPLTGHTNTAFQVAFSPDGKLLASASADRTVRLWDTATGQPHGSPLTGHTDSVYGVAFSPDGRLLASAGADRTVRLQDVATGRLHGQPLAGHTGPVFDVRFSPDGQMLASAGWDQTVRLWNTTEMYSVSKPLIGHTGYVIGLSFSPDGKLVATGGADGTVRLWDAATGNPVGPPLTGHTGEVFGVAFSPDGRLVAASSADRTVRLWDTATGQPHGQPLTGHSDTIFWVAFSPDGKLIATPSADHTVRLWDTATGQLHGPPLIGHTDTVYQVAFSPDGKLLASVGADRTVRLWDVATGQPHGPPLTGHTDTVFGVAFSPDGALLATASADQTVRLWDTATGKPHDDPLTGHTDTVFGVAFSPDGRLLATASEDHSVRLWDTATGQPHGPPLTAHTDAVNSVAFSPDGRVLASAGADALPRLWDLGFSRWIEAGCSLVQRNLSMSEWRQFAPDQPYERTCPDLPSGIGAPPRAPAAEYAPGL